MTKVFTGALKFTGLSRDYAIVTGFGGRMLICAFNGVADEAATIAMTPEQARLFAAGIVEAADRAEGKQ